MTSLVVGTKATRMPNVHIDVSRSPHQYYRLARLRARDIKKERGVYSVYCRLCHLEKQSGDSLNPWKQKNRSSPFELNVPGHQSHADPLRCRCDENSLNVIRQLHDETPSTSFDRTLPSRFTHDRFMNEVLSNFLINETAQMPLSTLIIRWRLGRNIPTYDREDLLGLLSCYGHVHVVYKQTPNSALVIFNDITSACRVMQAKHLGEPKNKVHCIWYHKFMSNKAFYSTSNGLRVRSDPYVQMHNHTVIRRFTPA